jgi:hypothetical protein
MSQWHWDKKFDDNLQHDWWVVKTILQEKLNMVPFCSKDGTSKIQYQIKDKPWLTHQTETHMHLYGYDGVGRTRCTWEDWDFLCNLHKKNLCNLPTTIHRQTKNMPGWSHHPDTGGYLQMYFHTGQELPTPFPPSVSNFVFVTTAESDTAASSWSTSFLVTVGRLWHPKTSRGFFHGQSEIITRESFLLNQCQFNINPDHIFVSLLPTTERKEERSFIT